MATLQKYLQDNLDKTSLDEICKKFHIKYKRHAKYENLYLFKYSNIAVNFSEAETRESRGVVLDSADNWKIVSYPYDKFFNYGEPHAASIDWSSSVIYEKLDGCLMTMYYYDNQWLVSSSGKPDAGGPALKDKNVTLEHVFWEIWTTQKYQLPTDTDVCYIFEMLSDKNPVNIVYQDNDIILHGARNVKNLQEFSPEPIATEYGWKCIPIHHIETNPDAIVKFANSRSGVNYEGVIVCDKNFNRIKIKSKEYVTIAYSLNSLKNRPEAARKRLFELITKDNINDLDELCTILPELGNVATEITLQIDKLSKIILDEYETIKDIEIQKMYAEKAKKSKYSGFMFMLRGGKNIYPKKWFAQLGYEKFMKLVSNTNENSE